MEKLVKRSDILNEVVDSPKYNTVNVENLKALIALVYSKNVAEMQSVAVKNIQRNIDTDVYQTTPWSGIMLQNLKTFLGDLQANPTIAAMLGYDSSMTINNINGALSFEDTIDDAIKCLTKMKEVAKKQNIRRYKAVAEMSEAHKDFIEATELLEEYMSNIAS